MDVSIIIVNYNTKELTLQCLKSVFDQTKIISFEVILIDNASTDGSIAAIREHYPQVNIIDSVENVGFGRANNLGVKHALGKYLFFLNSDTILLNNAILFFVNFFKENQNLTIGALGSILLNIKLSPIHSGSNFPQKKAALKFIFLHYFNKNQLKKSERNERLNFGSDTYFAIDYITGADLFIPKEVFNSLYGFDPIYFMYYEEVDLQKRMQKNNLSCFIIKGPKIIHLVGASGKSEIFSAFKRILVERSMFLYFKNHSSPKDYICFRIFYGFLRFPILVDHRISIRERLAYIKALWTFKL